MKKIGFIFPGQAAQYEGMGREIAERYPEVMSIYDEANKVLGYDLKQIIFEGPETKLMKTEITQPAVFSTSIAIFKALQVEGIKPNMMAGLSLGEYTALTAANSIAFPKMLELLSNRIEMMSNAIGKIKGGMAAILGLPEELIIESVKEASENGCVEIANYNSPNQIAITGELKAVKVAAKLCKEKGAHRVVVLPVSLPFHTSLLEPAGKEFYDYMNTIELKKPIIPIVSNYSVTELDTSNIPLFMSKQMYNPVRWTQCIEYMINSGIEIFVEVGPKDTLTKFVNQINPKVKAFNVENNETLDILLDYLK